MTSCLGYLSCWTVRVCPAAPAEAPAGSPTLRHLGLAYVCPRTPAESLQRWWGHRSARPRSDCEPQRHCRRGLCPEEGSRGACRQTGRMVAGQLPLTPLRWHRAACTPNLLPSTAHKPQPPQSNTFAYLHALLHHLLPPPPPRPLHPPPPLPSWFETAAAHPPHPCWHLSGTHSTT